MVLTKENMKITILNGSPAKDALETYTDKLIPILEKDGHAVIHLKLREMNIRNCTGCFKCWVKTPGHCVLKDDSDLLDKTVINSDFVLWASPLVMGFPSELLKRALDKHLPLLLPNMEIAEGEMHHVARYPHYPRIGMLVEKESTTEEDIRILTDIFARTALNSKSRLEFFATSQETPEQIADQMLHPQKGAHLYQRSLKAMPFTAIQPPHSITVFNGSPRGEKGSNTLIMLNEFTRSFKGHIQLFHLWNVKDTENHMQAFKAAECVWLGFPLYTDCMPSIVTHFIDALQPLLKRSGNPPIGFLVQSGFTESLHSRYMERYLEKLAKRLGSPYLGTIIKGGGEGIHAMPPQANQKLFQNLQRLGESLKNAGKLDEKVLSQIANPERIPALIVPLLKKAMRTPAFSAYFDGQLQKNGAYENRFDRPFLEES